MAIPSLSAFPFRFLPCAAILTAVALRSANAQDPILPSPAGGRPSTSILSKALELHPVDSPTLKPSGVDQELLLSGWHIVSSTAELDSDAVKFGFASGLQQGAFNLTLYNDTCSGPKCGNQCNGVTSHSASQGSQFYVPNASYFNYQNTAVPHLLYDVNGFINPANQHTFSFRLYFMSQELESGCANAGVGTAYSNDGIHFEPGPTAAAIPDCDPVGTPSTCSKPDFYCTYWPCSGSNPRTNWTTAEIVSPFRWDMDGQYYMAAFLFWFPDLSNCTVETGLCWPSNPKKNGTNAWFLQSADGLNWHRYVVNNGDQGRISRVGINTISSCYGSAWLINMDIAYDPVGQDFYMTRAIASSYGTVACGPGKLPDVVELYRAHGIAGVFNGPWVQLAALGCANLGAQPDSASIVKDGHGNVVWSGNNLTLLVSNSGGYGLPPSQNACAISGYPRFRVVVGP